MRSAPVIEAPNIAHPAAQAKLARLLNTGLLWLIFLNVLAVVLETEPVLQQRYGAFFHVFDIFSVAVFTVEYILRLWLCMRDAAYRAPITGRIRYALHPMALIDLLSILPFYLPFVGVDLRVVRALRLFRLFRLGKLGRYSQSLTTLGNVIRRKKEELVITLFAGGILLVIASSLMYFAEHEAQPDVFRSILSSMWWGAVTLTTVGYGDIYPQTLLGKVLGAVIALLGIGLFALPAGIIASGFASEIEKHDTEVEVCPHCGQNVHDRPTVGPREETR